MAENIGAMAAIALSVIGLAGLLPGDLAAVATIIVGAIFLMEGGTVSAAFRQLASRKESDLHLRELGGGITAEFFGGLAGIVLGILGLFRSSPEPLLGSALLVFGAATLLGGRTISRLNWLLQPQSHSASEMQSGAMMLAGAGSQMLIGLAAVVLGILAIVGMNSITLVLAGLLSLGTAALFTSSAMGIGKAGS